MAETEIASDFRLLYGHSLVGIYGALETMVTDLAAAWLLQVPQARQMPEVAAIKVPLAEFDALSPEERIYAIVSDLDRASITRRGIDRFERLRESVGLGGSYNAQIAENLYEMQQIRNLFAHRRGLAGRRFIAACPHLGFEAGDPVLLDEDIWTDCLVTSAGYAVIVFNRVLANFGPSPVEVPSVEPIRHRPRSSVPAPQSAG